MQHQGQNINIVQPIHCKKRLSNFPSQPGCHLSNYPWPGIIKLFPVRESSVSEIQAGDRKIINIFLQCTLLLIIIHFIVSVGCLSIQFVLLLIREQIEAKG
jgi:hypothetical protein